MNMIAHVLYEAGKIFASSSIQPKNITYLILGRSCNELFLLAQHPYYQQVALIL